jgi:hypothetical protein
METCMRSPLILFLLLPLIVLATSDTAVPVETGLETSPYLFMTKANSKKAGTIYPGQYVKVWLDGNDIKGQYLYATKTEIALAGTMDTVYVVRDQIHKIRAYNGIVKQVAGVGTMALGGASMFYGTLGAVIGTIGIVEEDWGAVVIILAPLLPVGYGLWVTGSRLYGRTYSTKRGWSFGG